MDLRFPLTGVLALLLAAAFFAAAWGVGMALLARVHAVRGRSDRALIEIAVGSGLLGYVAFALGLAGLLRPAVLGGVLAAGCAVLLWMRARDRVSTTRAPASAEQAGASPLLIRGTAAALGLALLLALLGAMLPEVEYDALWYHLTFPQRYLASGRLLDDPCNHMAPTPQHVELLYAYGLLFDDARGAKLIHYGFGVLAAAWGWLIAARYLGRAWALAAAALFLTAPTVTWEMTTAYNELPLAFVATGAVALLLDWRAGGRRTLLMLAGVLLGVGLAGKHLAMFFLAPLAVAVLFVRPPDDRALTRRLADAALLGIIAVAVALPWYVRAWAMTGNPLFPMFYDQLTALGVSIERWDAQAQRGWEAAMARYGHDRSLRDLLLLPFRATWHSSLYHGSLGPAWLLGLPLLALTWRRLHGDVRLLAMFVLVFLALWAGPWSSFQIRYLVPVAPLAGVVIAAAWSTLGEMAARGWGNRARILLEAGMVFVLITNLPAFSRLHDARSGWIATTFHDVRPRAWLTALGLHPHDQFLRSRLESYGAIPVLNALADRDERVVWFGEAAHFYARPRLVQDYSRCVVAGTWGSPPGAEAEAFSALRQAGVTYIAWDRTRRDLTDERFAVRSETFLQRYAELVHADDAIELYRLRVPPADLGPADDAGEHRIPGEL